MRGLVIKSGWLNLILTGKKTWELRSTATRIRELIALIESGSGLVVGVARIADVVGPLSEQQLLKFEYNHLVPRAFWHPYTSFKWRYAWVLQGVKRIDPPISYVHPPGAVIWVKLSAKEAQAVSSNLLQTGSSILENFPTAKQNLETACKPSPATMSPSNSCMSNNKQMPREFPMVSTQHDNSYFKIVKLTRGNINNNHFYLTPIRSWFPSNAIGGSNQSKKASKKIRIHWGGSEPVETDIAGDKMIFRSRSWIGELFKQHCLTAGDSLQISRVTDYEYVVTPARNSINPM